MAQMKRPAEKPTLNRGKRPRISKKDGAQGLEGAFQDAENASDHESVLEEEDVANSISKTVMNLKKNADGKKRWVQQFEKDVHCEEARLCDKIEEASTKIKDSRKTFRESMLPILESAIQAVDLNSDPAPEIVHPMVLEAPKETPAALKASEVLMKSQILLASYDILKETRPVPPSTTQMMSTFAKDKEEATRAFHAAKKMTMNQLKTKLANKLGETPQPVELTDDEQRLARRIMNNGKERGRRSEKTSGTGIGPFLHDVERVVGKLQNLVP